jgi:hypothetical protein
LLVNIFEQDGQGRYIHLNHERILLPYSDGQKFILLDAIEKKIPAAPMVYNYIDQNMPDWAKPTIQKLASSGFLQGDGGGLGLTGDMLRILVILDRASAFAR